MIKKLILIYLLNVSDWVCTVALLHTGLFYEANPLAQQFIGSIPLGLLIKCVLPAAAITVVAVLLRYLNAKELSSADNIIAFVLVFYLFISVDHIINFTVLILQSFI